MGDRVPPSGGDGPTESQVLAVLLTAKREADVIAETLSGLKVAFPEAELWVAQDGSADATGAIALAAGAQVVCCQRSLGKGGAATRGAESLLKALMARSGQGREGGLVILCDGDLGRSAARLAALAQPLAAGEADIATAAFQRRIGGGFGLLLAFARWCVVRRGGQALSAPLSGQRAVRAHVLPMLLPFAAGYGMEVGIAIDAARQGLRIAEVQIDLEHRAIGRTPKGFAHRGRQLLDVMRASMARR